MRNLLLSSALTLAFVMPMLAQEPDDPDVESRIIALENLSKAQACKAKDLKTLDKLLDRDFISISAEGRVVNKSQMLATIQSANILDYTASAIVVRDHRDTAVATGMYQIRTIQNGKLLVSRGRFVDTWMLKNHQWVEIGTLMTPAE
jgi:hypothetical protein